MQYKSKNNVIYDISQTHGDYMAYYNGKYIAKAENQTELEKILDEMSHSSMNMIHRYISKKPTDESLEIKTKHL